MIAPDPTTVPAPDPSGLLAGAAGLGIIAMIFAFAFAIAMGALGLWILYTVIWRAVRRGLREYHSPSGSRARAPITEPMTGPRNWSPPGW